MKSVRDFVFFRPTIWALGVIFGQWWTPNDWGSIGHSALTLLVLALMLYMNDHSELWEGLFGLVAAVAAFGFIVFVVVRFALVPFPTNVVWLGALVVASIAYFVLRWKFPYRNTVALGAMAATVISLVAIAVTATFELPT